MNEKGTEQATPQRKKKALEKGDSVRSRELPGAVAMLGAVLAISISAHGFGARWAEFYFDTTKFAVSGYAADERLWVSYIYRGMRLLQATTLTILISCFSGAFLTGVVQGGGIKLRFDWLQSAFTRINPVHNLHTVLGPKAIVRLMKSSIPAGVLLLLSSALLKTLILSMPVMSLFRLQVMLSSAYKLIFDATWLFLAWAGLDYIVEWKSWHSRLKMSKQEIREEIKESMGNPLVRSRIHQIQRMMRKRQVRADISRASVVITNPTHYAVALEFSIETMQAPTVLTKGRGIQASEIREAARWANVPIIENPPLARSLYKLVDPGKTIPLELYSAVAGILAFLYRQQVEQRIKQKGSEPGRQYEATGAHSKRPRFICEI